VVETRPPSTILGTHLRPDVKDTGPQATDRIVTELITDQLYEIHSRPTVQIYYRTVTKYKRKSTDRIGTVPTVRMGKIRDTKG
jgi:hypothetical protein